MLATWVKTLYSSQHYSISRQKNYLNDVNKCVLTFDTFISGNLTLKLIIVHPLSIEVHCRTKRADISCVFSWFTSKTLLRWHAGAETTYTNQRRDSVKARAVCAAAVSANQNWRHYGKGRHTNVSIKLHFNKILQSWLLKFEVKPNYTM